MKVSVAEKMRYKRFYVSEVEVYAGKIQCLYVYILLLVFIV